MQTGDGVSVSVSRVSDGQEIGGAGEQDRERERGEVKKRSWGTSLMWDGETRVRLGEHEAFCLARRRERVQLVEVAARAGVHKAHVSLWETGQRELRAETRDVLWSALSELVRVRRGDDNEQAA